MYIFAFSTFPSVCIPRNYFSFRRHFLMPKKPKHVYSLISTCGAQLGATLGVIRPTGSDPYVLMKSHLCCGGHHRKEIEESEAWQSS